MQTTTIHNRLKHRLISSARSKVLVYPWKRSGTRHKTAIAKKRGTMAVLVLSGVKTSQSLTRGRTSTRRNPLHCRRASGCWQHPVRFRRAPTARLYYVKPRPSRRAKSHHNFRITKGPSRVRHSARARAARGHREALRNSNKRRP